MRYLCEHPDFRDFLIGAAEETGLREEFVEKDYYVTEALRLVAQVFPVEVFFKGGTSLAKGWKLIDRFSEDLDLFLKPDAFTPALSKNGITNKLKALRDAVGSHPHLHLKLQKPLRFARSDVFEYPKHFSKVLIVRPEILVEAGIQSGDFPFLEVPLSSHVADFVRQRAHLDGIADDVQPFRMQLLHFRRTCVEKMFALHSKITLASRDGVVSTTMGTYMRHYADIHALIPTPEVQQMLRSDEYGRIAVDYDAQSRKHFPQYHVAPEGLRLRDSIAMFPDSDLRNTLRDIYNQHCPPLFAPPAKPPSFDEVLASLEEVRDFI